MKKFFRRLIIFLALFAVHPAPSVYANNSQYLDEIAKANDLYVEKKYDSAAKIYESLIDRGVQNGYLYYNLGNAYFRQGKIGYALLNYLRAHKWLPRDKALEANLNYAIQETVDQLDWDQPSLMKTLFFWLDDFNLIEHLRIFLAVNFIFWFTLIAWWYYRSGAWDIARKIALVILIIAGLSTGAKYYLHNHSKIGVVLDPSLDIKSATNMDNVTLFKLNEGAVVSIKKETKDWVQIELADGKKGWAPKEFIGY